MTQISKEYATALFSLAREEGREAEFSDALKTIADVFRSEPEYLQILDSRALDASLRSALAEKAFGRALPEYVISFVGLLCEKGRIREFFDCADEYERMYKHFLEIAEVEVTSAVPLTEEEKSALIAKLEKTSGKKVSAHFSVDPSVLGGIIVRSDGAVIDGSLRSKLDKVKEVIEK